MQSQQADMDMTQHISTLLGERKILLLVRFGSELYGTAGKDSDEDIRAVFMPTADEILSGEVDFTVTNKTSNDPLGKGDLDFVGYSLMKFLDLLGKFDYSAIEMLYASQDPANTLASSSEINWVYNSRHSLIATGEKSPLSIVRRNLGDLMPDNDDHREILRPVVRALEKLPANSKLIDHIDTLSDLASSSEHIRLVARTREWEVFGDKALEIMLEPETPRNTTFFMQVNSAKHDLTRTVAHIHGTLTQLIAQKDKQKQRAKSGNQSDSVKIYHAVRILDQIIEITATDNLLFPRGCSKLLKQIKTGELGEAELKKHIFFNFQNAISALEDLPYGKERCVNTYREMLTKMHRDHIA